MRVVASGSVTVSDDIARVADVARARRAGAKRTGVQAALTWTPPSPPKEVPAPLSPGGEDNKVANGSESDH